MYNIVREQSRRGPPCLVIQRLGEVRQRNSWSEWRLGRGCVYVSRHGAFIIVAVIVFVDVDGRRYQLAAGQYVIDHGPGEIPGGDRVLGRNERVQVVAARHLIVLRKDSNRYQCRGR